MGRILEALQRTEPSKKAPREPAIVKPMLAPIPVDAQTDGEEVIPFIEVGGKNAMECSAGLVAVPPLEKPPRPALAHLDPPWTAPVVSTSMPALTGVAFRPLPLQSSHGPSAARFAPELVTYHQPDAALSGQYTALLASLTAQITSEAPVVLFTHGANHAGQTTVLLNLAITYARRQIGQTVVVETGGGAMAQRLGMSAAPGLREALSGKASLRNCVRETAQPGLHLLSAGESATSSNKPLALEKLRPFLQQLRDHFDWVWIDGPAWDGTSELTSLAAAAEAVYLVVREAELKSHETADLFHRIPQRGGRLCGYIVTQP